MHHHDALWKGLLQAFFSDFLKWVLPDLASRLEPERPTFLEKEAFTDPPDGQKALLDLVAEVPSRSGLDEVILIHVEVERAFGHAMDRRMWRYFSHLSLKYEHPIVPIVLFLRGGPGGVTERIVEHRAAGLLVNRFRYWSLGLSGCQAKSFLEYPPLGIALAACARGDRLPLAEQKFLCIEKLLDAKVDQAQRELLMTAIETYLKLNEKQKMQYAERVAKSAREREVRAMELTWAGELHQKGVREGVEAGRREGVEAGRREGTEVSRRLLTLILSQRFGEASQSLAGRIQQLEKPSEIEAISRRAMQASDIAELMELLKTT